VANREVVAREVRSLFCSAKEWPSVPYFTQRCSAISDNFSVERVGNWFYHQFIGVAHMRGLKSRVWLLTAIVAAATSAARAQERVSASIAWHTDVQEAVAAARESQRPILVFVTAEGCGYCRKMERQTWADSSVVDAVARSYVPLRLDAQVHPELIQRLRIEAFPTVLLFTPEGNWTVGAADSSRLRGCYGCWRKRALSFAGRPGQNEIIQRVKPGDSGLDSRVRSA